MKEKKYLVYKHKNLNTNKVFYIGCSSNKNIPFDFKQRSLEWIYIYNNNPIEVEIISSNLEKENALELEYLLISEIDGLVNKLGNGWSSWNLGKKHTKNHLKKLSINSIHSKKVLCTKTNNIFNSATEASKITKYSISHLKNMLNGYRKNKTYYVWA